MRCAVVLLTLAATPVLYGAPPAEEIRKLVDTALATPPEIAADALIRIAESPKVSDRPYAIELLHQAFTLASSAVHPYRRVGGAGAAQGTDTDAGRLSSALNSGLDGHSLQVRATRALLALDKEQGAKMFSSLPPPAFPALTCRDSMLWRTDAYYDLVLEVFNSGFTERQKKEGRHVAMLEDQLRGMNSTFHLEPLTRMLLAVQVSTKLSTPQFERLLAVYATGLKALRPDDRSFSSGTRHGFTQAFYDLVAQTKKLNLSVTPLFDAYRTYLQDGIHAKRCEDSADPNGEGATVVNMVYLLNGELKKLEQDLISPPAAGLPTVPERAQVYSYWTSPSARKLFGTMVALTRREDKASDDWERQTRQFFNDVNDWEKDHGESPVNFFHQRAMLYTAMLRNLAAGALRVTAAKDYLNVLVNSDVRRLSPPEWYMYARDLAAIVGREEIERSADAGVRLPFELRRVLEGK
ncbi:MAG TPA: hypothetical protein VER03_15915 [Bryobacteraceae bacterium]|nr:hypothetical protein [Bryobacteraceae bacterium]